MRQLWDVAIVGAGPAGAAAAMAALRKAPGASVLLLDRAEFPRDKSCGDAVAPHAADLLVELGAGGLLEEFPPIRAMRFGLSSGVTASRAMRRPIRVVPRTVFDHRLVMAAEELGAVRAQHTVRSVKRTTSGEVEVDGKFRARVLIGADGAESVVRRQLGYPPPAAGHVAVALRGYAPVQPAAPVQVVCRLGEWPAYAWSFPLGDGRANVGYGEVLRSAPRSRRELLAALDELIPKAAAGAVNWRGARLPLSTRRPKQPDGPVLLAGDAASLVNPMSGEGIYYALLSGARAGAAAVGAGDPGRSYRAALQAALGAHLRDTATAVRLARVPVIASTGIAAARDDQAVFDAYIDLAVGDGRMSAGGLARAFAGVVRRSGAGRRLAAASGR